MSAPNSRTRREQRRHRPALIGIGISVILAGIVAVVLVLTLDIPATEQATPVPTTDGGAGESATE